MKAHQTLKHLFLAGALMFGLLACAAPPLQPPKKVQTIEEFLTKLKWAFDKGTLTDPDFYAKELGYPLLQPLDYKTQKAFDINSAEGFQKYDEGVFKGKIYRVIATKSSEDLKVLYLTLSAYDRCVHLDRIREIWGQESLIQTPDPALHRRGATNPPLFFEKTKQVGNSKRVAKFSVSSKDYCLSNLIITETF